MKKLNWHGNQYESSRSKTFLSTIFSHFSVMMPLWMLFLGDHFLVDHPNVNIRIPYGNICTSMMGLALPLLIGILIRKYKKNWAEQARKVRLKRFSSEKSRQTQNSLGLGFLCDQSWYTLPAAIPSRQHFFLKLWFNFLFTWINQVLFYFK